MQEPGQSDEMRNSDEAGASWTPPEGSWASSAAIRKTMLGSRSRDTRPELALRSAVHRLGLRYRVSAAPIPGLRRTADLLFRQGRVAVFVDGCFFHGCPSHYSPPKTNTTYWAAKVARNQDRDADTDARLSEAGWEVVRIWQHEDPDEAAARVAAVVRRRRTEYPRKPGGI